MARGNVRLALLITALLLSGSTARHAAAQQPVDEGRQSANKSGTEKETTTALRRAIIRAADNHSTWDSLQLSAECQGDKGMRSLQVFGNGPAIWNNRRQFTLTPDQIASLLATLRDADFAGLKEIYGGKRDLPRPAHKALAIRVTCRLRLALDGLTKRSVQRVKGEQSALLRKLADDLFRICEIASQSGVEATDIRDGLQKLSSGELAAETFQVMLHRKPDQASALEGNQGFLLRINGNRVTSRSYDPVGGYLDPLNLSLGRSDLDGLARKLAELDPGKLPANLYALDYTDLSIPVLNHRKSIQARQFAGMTPATHGERQKECDALFAVLAQLHVRVINEGDPETKKEEGTVRKQP